MLSQCILLSILTSPLVPTPPFLDPPPLPEVVTEQKSPPESTIAEAHNETLLFADHLLKDGDYYRAITEYRRYLFLQRGQGPQSVRAAMAIGEALWRGEQWNAASRQFDSIAQRTNDMSIQGLALLNSGHVYLESNMPELSLQRLHQVKDSSLYPESYRCRANWLVAWGQFHSGAVTQAIHTLDTIKQQATMAQNIDEATQATQLQTAFSKQETLEYKSPLAAGLLSIIPGAGHLYMGHVGIGITSFLWVGLFGASTVMAFVNQQWALGGVLSLLTVGWYSGGMFGAVAAAYRHNRDVVKNWRDTVQNTYGEQFEMPLQNHVETVAPGTAPRFGVE